LPRKGTIEILFHPIAGILLHVAHNIGEAMHWAQACQQMNVIGYSPDDLCNAVHPTNNASQVGMYSRTPFNPHKWQPPFGGKYDVVVKTKKG